MGNRGTEGEYVGRTARMDQAMLWDNHGTTGPPREDDTDLTVRGRALRRKIMDIAKHCFARYGYEQVSLQDVAVAANLEEERVLRYFPDKGRLLRGILDDGWKDMLARLRNLESSSVTARSAMLALLSLMSNILQKDEDLFRLFLLEGRLQDPAAGELGFTEGYRRFMQLCRDLVLRGQRDGSFRPNLHPRVAASMLVGALEGMLRDRLVATQERSITPYTGIYVMPAFDALVAALS